MNRFVARQYHPQSQELGSLVTVATGSLLGSTTHRIKELRGLVTVATCGSKRLTTAPWPHSRRLHSPKCSWDYSPIPRILLTTANFGRQRLKSACFSWLSSPEWEFHSTIPRITELGKLVTRNRLGLKRLRSACFSWLSSPGWEFHSTAPRVKSWGFLFPPCVLGLF
jgi:hypothetical protein